MFKKLTMTAGTLAVIVVLALVVFSISSTLSPQKITAARLTTTPTRVVATANPTAGNTPTAVATLTAMPTPGPIRTPIQLGPQNSMSVADWSPDGKRLIIRNDGDFLLYVVNRDGTGLTKLPVIARSAHWSADGSIEICVNPPQNPKTRKLFSVSPDGSNLKELPDNKKVAALLEGNCDPVHSPDGKTIAFAKRDGLGLYFMDANGENVRQVVVGAESDVTVHKWTVDASGTSLIYSSLDLSTGTGLKWINEIKFDNAGFPVGGHGLHGLTAGESAFWRLSPDAKKIAFIPNAPTGIYTLDVSDGWTQQLVDLPLPSYFEQTALWSPDASQIAFMSDSTGDLDIFVMNADGSNLRYYPNPNSLDQVISWSPDGLSLVFSSQVNSLTPPLYLYLLDVKDLQAYTNLWSITGIGACSLDNINYVVSPSDNLLSVIASRFSVSTDSIIALNKLDAAGTISVGQKLLIPLAPRVLVDGVAYTVVDNDTVESIAVTFGVSAEKIRAANYLGSDGTISSGQQLFIPLGWHLPMKSIYADLDIFKWPLANHSVLEQDNSNTHPGMSISAKAGDVVWAAQDGIVTFAGAANGDLGNTIIIQHRDGLETIYAHLDEVRVVCLQSVSASQVIGTVGQTGGATKPFLYFVMRTNGSPGNPAARMPSP